MPLKITEQSPIKIRTASMPQSDDALEKKPSPLKLYLLTAITLLFIVVLNTVPAVKDTLFRLESAVHQFGWIGPVLLILINGLVVIPLGLPTVVFEMTLALLIRNFLHVLAISLITKVLGAAASFVLTRYILKQKIRNLFDGLKAFKGLEQAVNRSPFKFSIIIRITAMPLFIKNYGLAIPNKVTFQLYMLCSFLTTVPTTVCNIYLLRQAGDVASLVNEGQSWGQMLGSAAMVAVNVFLFIYTAKYTKKVLKELEGNKAEETDKTK